MTLDGIRAALMTRMASWTDAPAAWEGLPTPPAVEQAQASKSPWIFVRVDNGDTLTNTVGDATTLTGLIAVQIHTAQDIGTKPANDIADSVIAHLQHYRGGGLLIRQAQVARAGPGDGYYRLALNFPFIAR
jgi:hypothetical protein